MLHVIGDLLLVAGVTLAGIGFGWWLRRNGSASAPEQPSSESSQEIQRSKELLTRLRDLAARVAADVGRHNERVEQINEELHSVETPEAESVVGAVAKLLEANQQMQHKLAFAEERLQDQAREIETKTAEARTDALTGLSNRRALDAELARQFVGLQSRGQAFALLMVDVDHFKRFNDQHGHQTGDDVLREVGRVLHRRAGRKGFAARYGGEEFALLLPAAPLPEMAEVAEQIRRDVGETTFSAEGKELRVTISLGLAQIRPQERLSDLIRRADEALYVSKNAGRNCSHWHDGKRVQRLGELPVEPLADSREMPAQGQAGANRPERPQPVPERPGRIAAEPLSHLGLCNRTAFCTKLGSRIAEFRRGGSVAPAALMLRVDLFDEIRKANGESAANDLLRTVVEALEKTLQQMDFVAHYYPDTFAALLPGAEPEFLLATAEHLQQALRACEIAGPQGALRMTSSLGLAIAVFDDDATRLLHRAELALRIAAGNGGNCAALHNGQSVEQLHLGVEPVSKPS